jgi:carbon-monoxide dehydrogenase medium subunit
MRYEAPGTVKAAVTLLSQARGSARILAGGTDLLVQMKTDRIAPDLLIDVKRISGMHDILTKGAASASAPPSPASSSASTRP